MGPAAWARPSAVGRARSAWHRPKRIFDRNRVAELRHPFDLGDGSGANSAANCPQNVLEGRTDSLFPLCCKARSSLQHAGLSRRTPDRRPIEQNRASPPRRYESDARSAGIRRGDAGMVVGVSQLSQRQPSDQSESTF